MEQLLDSMAMKYYPGIDMCVYKEHKEIFRYQAGYSDIEKKTPVNPNAQYYMFSCTKPITCAAAMQIYEKGGFLMGDYLYDYLPEYKDVCVKEKNENGEVVLTQPKRPIRIIDLFTMMAGYDYNLNRESFKKVEEKTGGKCPTREIIRALADDPLIFHPGEQFHYSLCHDILGAIIEEISGKTLGEYMKENIFEPCGMDNTGFVVTQEVKNNMPPMYKYKGIGNFEKAELENPYILGEKSEYESGGAGLISNVEDYIKFADAMANGGVAKNGKRILSEKAIDVMRQPYVPVEKFSHPSKVLMGYTYGLGVRTFQYPQNSAMLSNIGEFGWDGAADSYVLIDPKEKIAMFCAEHMRDGNHADAPGRFTNVLYSIISNM